MKQQSLASQGVFEKYGRKKHTLWAPPADRNDHPLRSALEVIPQRELHPARRIVAAQQPIGGFERATRQLILNRRRIEAVRVRNVIELPHKRQQAILPKLQGRRILISE